MHPIKRQKAAKRNKEESLGNITLLIMIFHCIQLEQRSDNDLLQKGAQPHPSSSPQDHKRQ